MQLARHRIRRLSCTQHLPSPCSSPLFSAALSLAERVLRTGVDKPCSSSAENDWCSSRSCSLWMAGSDGGLFSNPVSTGVNFDIYIFSAVISRAFLQYAKAEDDSMFVRSFNHRYPTSPRASFSEFGILMLMLY